MILLHGPAADDLRIIGQSHRSSSKQTKKLVFFISHIPETTLWPRASLGPLWKTFSDDPTINSSHFFNLHSLHNCAPHNQCPHSKSKTGNRFRRSAGKIAFLTFW